MPRAGHKPLIAILAFCEGERRIKCRYSRAWRVCVVEKFSRIQNVVWIENLLQLVMQVANNWTGGLRPPTFFGQADSVLAGNYAARSNTCPKKMVSWRLNLVPTGWAALAPVAHEVDGMLPATGTTKRGDRDSVF